MRFGPPDGVTRPSPWPWIDRPASGLLPATNALFRLAFATATPHRLNLATESNSLTHYAKGTPSPSSKARLRPLVGRRFQVLFHSPPGVLFTFPSRYLSTIGRRGVFSLGGWAPQIPTGFHVPRGTRDTPQGDSSFHVRGYHPLWPTFPDRSASLHHPITRGPTTPSPRRSSVWATPLSLAATQGISVDFSSSGY